ncbi:MAG: dockerin type I domain-containing protein [Oscillospiraceae bacterium]|jgi:hypothetical protein|nr:dockerin type I domain-containing protein [Oscillospiraceae bacterium]
MKTIKKPISLFLTFVMIISITWASPIISGASDTLDPSKMTLEEYIAANIENFVQEINISHYILENNAWIARIINNDSDALIDEINIMTLDIIQNNPQFFYVESAVSASFSASINTNTNTIVFLNFRISLNYFMTSNEYRAAKRRFDNAVAEALDYAKNADTEFEKALALHDYLVLNTVYDSDSLNHFLNTGKVLRHSSHTAYGALVNGTAVCDGYSKAYMYLLNRVGVENRIITGTARNVPHAWNVVKIDGAWYHVDVTFNDPLINNQFDLHGRVSHTFFLLSDAALIGNQTHADWTLPAGIRANSSAYDNAFFRDVETAVIKLGDFLYWIHSSTPSRGTNNNSIRRYNINTGAISTLHSFEAIWFLDGSENRWVLASFVSIAAYNNIIYFNTAREIRSYDPATGAVETIHTPANLGGSGNRFIHGLTMRGETITYTIKTHAATADNFFEISVPSSFVEEPLTDEDALIILKYEVGLIILTPQQRARYDLNGDGYIDSTDALIILKMLVGLL